MDCPNFITEHAKGKHLIFEERVIIQTRLKDGYTAYRIAKELKRAGNTVRNEIRKGTVVLYRGKVHRYQAKAGQAVYERNRQHCLRNYSRLVCKDFIQFVVENVQRNHWSLDACFGEASLNQQFKRSEMVCTKTLYNYVDLGLLTIRNCNLPLKLQRSTKQSRVRKNKKRLGRSIEERPDSIGTREEFGHWEIDTVIGAKTKDDEVLLTLAERKTRNYIVRKISDKSASSVMEAIKALQEEYGTQFDKVFKTITADNGSEFADLSQLEVDTGTKIYFAHPYTSCERGTNERHNGLLRRFIPKGNRIDKYSADYVAFVEEWCNLLPRKILNYHTPDELFEHHLDVIYAA